MPLYELINPSDPYTFEAPDIVHAGVAAVLLSTGFGAEEIGGNNECTPVLFGWNEWLEERGVDNGWITSHAEALADVWDSFLIGKASARKDVEEMLAMIPPEKQAEWKASRQERHRSSLNQIGEAAYRYAAAYRSTALAKGNP